MRRFIQNIQATRTPHERRQHATQIAGVLTAAVFVVWLTTLGVRLAAQNPSVANTEGSANQTQLAGAASGLPADAYGQQNVLEVATSTDYGQ